MKKIIVSIFASIAFLSVKAQVDPAFTAKMVNISNAVKSWYENGQPSSGSLFDAVGSSVAALYPISNATFNTKLQAMLGSSTEMAKFSNPIAFVQCLGTAAGQQVACVNAYVEQTGDFPPSNQDPPHCYTAFQNAIVQCAITHLTR